MRARHSGFTLIEVMMVVGIVGILSSVAIPQMKKLQLRSKQAERALMMAAIEKASDDYYARDTRYPTDEGGGVTSLTGDYNPAFPPGVTKRPFAEAQAGWKNLSLKVEGNLFYSYYVEARADPSKARQSTVYAYGDLDGDKNYACYAYDQRTWSAVALTSQQFWDAAIVPGATFGCY